MKHIIFPFFILKNILFIYLFKNEFYTLNDLIEESNHYDNWIEAEWGFPKGRRNYQETDFECALREFSEETGYSIKNIKNIIYGMNTDRVI